MTSVPAIVVQGSHDRPGAELVGGKAFNLDRLSHGGLPIPSWFCVTTQVYRELADPLHQSLSALLSGLAETDPADIGRLSEQVRALILSAPFPESASAAIEQTGQEMFPGDVLLAVRSSAVGEDSASDSFAGQMDSYLFVRRGDIVARIQQCFASAFSARSLLYRRLRGHDPLEVRAAVVVQRMVASTRSGVLFTANPITGEAEEMVISAGYGLGEGIVGDLVTGRSNLAGLFLV